jgi:hypothetical protein
MTEPTQIIGQIKTATGKQIYTFLREMEKSIKEGKRNSNFFIWQNECYERARELIKNRYGDWEQAKNKLDMVREPNLEKYENKLISMCLDDINGYPCVYSREKTKEGIKSCVYITNGKTNTMYLKHFGEVTHRQANEIFNA